MSNQVKSRAEMDPKYTWNPHSIFATEDAWEAEIERLKAEIPKLVSFKGRLSESDTTLANFLQLLDDVDNRMGKVNQYAGMFHYVDMNDQAADAKNQRVQFMFSEFVGAISFMAPELLAIGEEQVMAWTEKNPELRIYRTFFESLFLQKDHIRSHEVEEVLSQATAPFNTATEIHSTLVYADLKFDPIQSDGEAVDIIELSQGNINTLLKHANREIRRQTWENYADAHLALKNTLATSISTGMKRDVFYVKARRYKSSLDAALSPNNLPEAVFHTLLETYRKHIPLWQRYWKVKREGLGYDQFHVYDIKAPLLEKQLSLTFEQAVDWICEGMQPLGEDYVQVMRRGCLEERWVDVFPNKGKAGGAFSSGTKGTHPFILTNFTEDIFGMSTLAHELGHSMHSYHTWQAQPFIYTHYSMFVAEVASNFNQALVRAHLLAQNEDPAFQIAVIEEAMANFHRYFFIMPILASWEYEIHQRTERGDALTANSLIELMTDLFKEGYGDEVVIDADRIGITWAQFPHHLYENFYVFQYATGISAAHALADGVLHGDAKNVENYLAFLRSGNSLYPLDALKLAGVDMTSTEPVEKTFAVLAQLIDRLEVALQQL